MAKLPLRLKKLEEIGPNDSSPSATMRLYDTDWFMIHWLLNLWEETPRDTTQAEIFKELARSKLAALYAENREKIERLQESSRRDHAFKQEEEPGQKKGPKK